ncbi:cuticle protein 18.7-like [Zerene cesonia]|uniref:cuticle protein 18.7-like n=1 Tax=Zerene cesonia TaxID=33412 RepID=UPI0018E510C0|nr:cuticle protein 18.7-like [Zerene cesonia]
MYKLVVLFSVLALAAAKPNWVSPVVYSAASPVVYGSVSPVAYSSVVSPAVNTVVSPAVSSVSQYSSSVVHGSPAVPAVYSAYAPVSHAVVPAVAGWSQAPGSPAVVLDAVQGVPLDTPEVVAARAAHYQAKALSGVHRIAKRSLAAVAPVTYSYPLTYSSPTYVSAYSPYVSTYSSPAVSSYAVVPKALSVHPW